jgi:hypothetical protein
VNDPEDRAALLARIANLEAGIARGVAATGRLRKRVNELEAEKVERVKREREVAGA